MRQAAACECGQVLFDIVERKAGDTLTCPWCNREYRYLGDGKVEPAKPASGDTIKKPQSKELAKEKDKPEPEKPEKSEKPEKKEREKEKEPAEARRSAENYGTRKQEDTVQPRDPLAPKGSRRIKARKDDVPGGFPIMIGFIIGFNGAAFIGLAVIRMTEWEKFVPRSATWPLIAALVLGHIVGFVAWSAFVYYKLESNKEGADGSGPSPGS
jgi:hypothetical protein